MHPRHHREGMQTVTTTSACQWAILVRGLAVQCAAGTGRDDLLHPKPGDLVVDVSSWSHRADPDGVGWLLRVEVGAPSDRWVIEPLGMPGTEQGWANCQFVAVPAHVRDAVKRAAGAGEEIRG